MKLYHCKGSRSCRVLWLLEELALEYELEVLPFDRHALQSVDYLSINPFGKVPVLVDDAVTMFESVAIIQYLLRRYGEGRLEPPDAAPEYGQFLQWMHFAESTLMGPVAQIALHTALLPENERHPDIAAAGRRAFTYYARTLNQVLSGQTYLVDDEFTASDIVMGYTLHAAHMFGSIPAEHKALHEYYQRLKARPAFQTAMS
jgi:glutathione S-transferase